MLLFQALARAEAAEISPHPSVDPQVSIHEGFVEEKVCSSCHAGQAEAFAKSNHAKAMALADDRSVRADFNDTRFEHNGIQTTFLRRDGRFFVRTPGPDGEPGEFEVKYTFAYEPLQQYLVDAGGGRLQALDIAWDTTKKEWFWLGEGAPARPGTTNHWTGPFYRWNRTCIDCHSTNPLAKFQPETNSYESTYVATSVGCQSCHGGGEKHVNWAKARAQDPAAAPESDTGLAPVDASMCFACHSRRTKLLDGYKPGDAFLDHFSPSLIGQGLYFPDGQILEEDFEYGSFLQSKMARAGVTCLDCHSAHEATLKAEGNAVCTQCHTEAAQERFANFHPNGSFDTPQHTHHPVGSPGAECANCHMPRRAYMKVDPRRDHSIVIPRPDLSMAYGTPNGCTTCHSGETNAWAAGKLDEWYGASWRQRPTIAHAFAAAERNDPAALEALRKLVTDREQSALVRGSALAEMGRVGGEAAAADVRNAAQAAEPLIRLGAAEAAGELPPPLRREAIGSLLADKTRAVRFAAVRALASTPSLELLGDQRTAFDTAVEDLRAYVQANADMAETQTVYGLFLLEQHRMEEAEAMLRRAISLDPSYAGAHINLAELYRIAGQDEKSERTYAAAIAISPEEPGLRYGHALALVRGKSMPGAVRELEEAVRLEPGNATYRTTLAVALDAVGRTDDAFAMLDGAIAGGLNDPDVIGTAIQFGLKLGRYRETLKHAEALARAHPDDPQIADLVRQLRAVGAGGN
ncbi:MAG: multiheme c-type cytochrome [Hyphomicrobiales bacterium]|nr:multiheme c-type cytochrome [Hyphomicrobiales bacterium]